MRGGRILGLILPALLAACSAQPTADVAAPAPVLGQQLEPYPVQFSCPASGTVVETTAGTRRYYGADPVDPETCIMERPGSIGREWRLYSLFTPDAYDSDQLRAVLRRVFPLEAGKVVSQAISGPEGGFRLTFTVVGLSQVRLPAGTFTAWTLDIREVGQRRGRTFVTARRVVLDQVSWVELKEDYRIPRGQPRAGTASDWQALRITAPTAP